MRRGFLMTVLLVAAVANCGTDPAESNESSSDATTTSTTEENPPDNAGTVDDLDPSDATAVEVEEGDALGPGVGLFTEEGAWAGWVYLKTDSGDFFPGEWVSIRVDREGRQAFDGGVLAGVEVYTVVWQSIMPSPDGTMVTFAENGLSAAQADVPARPVQGIRHWGVLWVNEIGVIRMEAPRDALGTYWMELEPFYAL